MNFSKQNIALCLITIGTISIILKISLVDFSLPVVNNDQLFSLRAISYNPALSVTSKISTSIPA